MISYSLLARSLIVFNFAGWRLHHFSYLSVIPFLLAVVHSPFLDRFSPCFRFGFLDSQRYCLICAYSCFLRHSFGVTPWSRHSFLLLLIGPHAVSSACIAGHSSVRLRQVLPLQLDFPGFPGRSCSGAYLVLFCGSCISAPCAAFSPVWPGFRC